jgi:hypothetical protein
VRRATPLLLTRQPRVGVCAVLRGALLGDQTLVFKLKTTVAQGLAGDWGSPALTRQTHQVAQQRCA